MEIVKLFDVAEVMAYVSERNPQCAVELNTKLHDRITELHNGLPSFPSVAIMLSNDPTPIITYDPATMDLTDYLFLYIVDIGPGNVAGACNTIFTINTATGVIEDRTHDLVTVQ